MKKEDIDSLEATCIGTSSPLVGRRYGNGNKQETAEQMKGWISGSIDASLANPDSVDDFFVLETEEGFVVCILGNGPTSEQNGEFFIQARAKVPALIASHREATTQLAAATKRADDAEKQRDAALAVLTKHQWSQSWDGEHWCLECGGLSDKGHTTDCALAACLNGGAK